MKITRDLNNFLKIKKKSMLIKKIDDKEEAEENLHKGNKIDKKA